MQRPPRTNQPADPSPYVTPDLPKILAATAIAVVGCSPRPSRTSHRIARYLLDAGYDVVPVNPFHETILDRRCYPSVAVIGSDAPIGIVNIFRRPAFTAEMVADAIQWSTNTGTRPVIWTQLGVSSQAAEELAQEAGLPYVRNRCIMVEHARLSF